MSENGKNAAEEQPETQSLADAAAQQMQAPMLNAFIVPVPMFTQMVELIRGNVCHRDAAPVLDQVSTLQPQQVRITNT